MKYEVTGYNCLVELTIEQFTFLEDELDYLDFVEPTLNKLGAMEIEYNGHFGAGIFFHVRNLEDAQKVTDKIKEMIAV